MHPGLSDVAAVLASGSNDPAEALSAGVQTIDAAGTAVPVVVASPGGGETRSALPILTGGDLKALNPPEKVVIADIGRLDPVGPAWPVAAGADLVLLVIEGTLGGVGHLRFRLDQVQALETFGTAVALAVREADYSSREVADALLVQGHDLRVLGPLGPDPSGTGNRRRRQRSRTPSRWQALAETVRVAAGEGPLALRAREDTDAAEETTS
jgi:hypothetical protein